MVLEHDAWSERGWIGKGEVTVEQLCARSGLSQTALTELEAAGLLRPDRRNPEPLYRPKLVSWAHKLAFLLEQGWTIAEITGWARGRWQTPDPRAWPPERKQWQVDKRGMSQEGNFSIDGVSRQRIHTLIRQGRLGRRIGGYTVISQTELEHFKLQRALHRRRRMSRDAPAGEPYAGR